jgi:hypothetical protein
VGDELGHRVARASGEGLHPRFELGVGEPTQGSEEIFLHACFYHRGLPELDRSAAENSVGVDRLREANRGSSPQPARARALFERLAAGTPLVWDARVDSSTREALRQLAWAREQVASRAPARLTAGYLLAVKRAENLPENAMRADKTWVLRLLNAARRLTASATRIH